MFVRIKPDTLDQGKVSLWIRHGGRISVTKDLHNLKGIQIIHLIAQHILLAALSHVSNAWSLRRFHFSNLPRDVICWIS